MADANSTAQILQNIGQAQQERLKAMNAQRIQYAGMPANALANAYQSFLGGRKQASEEQHASDVHDLTQAQMAQSQSQLQLSQLQQQEMQATAAAKDEVDPNSEEGQTFREESLQLPADIQRENMANATQAAADSHAQTLSSIQNAKAALSSTLRAGNDSHQNMLQNSYEHDVDNAALQPPGPERDKQIAALGAQYTQKGLNPDTVASGAHRAALSDAAKASQMAASNLAFYTGDPAGVQLHSNITDATKNADYYEQLNDLATTLHAGLYAPGFDVNSTINETSTAADARLRAAQLMQAHGDTASAKALSDPSVNWDSALDKLNRTIDLGAPAAVSQWQKSKLGVPDQYVTPGSPNYKALVGSTDQRMQNLLNTRQNAAGGLPKLDQVNPDGSPLAPPPAPPATQMAPPAPAGQGAIPAPAQAAAPPPMPAARPVAAPAAPPASTSAFVIPSTDPYLGQ